ncbi:MAG: TIM barrel protein [Bacteroidales bacterium]|nr:TIM barrel protein [Bacteroidales bacterium]
MKKNPEIIILSIAVVSLFFSNSCSQELRKKNIGIQLWSVRENMKEDPAKTIEELGKTGYAFIEAASYFQGKFYEMSPVDFRTLVEKNNMLFLSSHTGLPVPDSASWESSMAWWDTCISAHAEAGVSYIVQPFMDSVGYSGLNGLQRYCDYFNAVGEKCRKKGIRFGYHNHSGEFAELDGQTIYDYMLEHTDSSLVFFQADLYWIYLGGKNSVDYFTRYPGRFTLWHVKDEKEIGVSGKMDFKTIFENAETAGMKYAIVEQEEYTTTPMEGVKKSLEFLLNADYVK